MTGDTDPALSIEAFERGDVDPSTFDHAAHVYVAWLYVGRFSLPDAVGRFTAALKRLTAALGAPEKYHETISWFYLLLIAERRHETGDDWRDFRRQNSDLFGRNGDILDRYYSKATLASEQARRNFVLPDRIELPAV